LASVAQAIFTSSARRNAIPSSLIITDVMAPFVVSRVLFALITISSSWWIPTLHFPSTAPAIQGRGMDALWFRWDAQWYARVATDGYRTIAYANGHLNLAFFPLYPLLVHCWLLFWHGTPAAAGMIVSNLCFVAASYYLYQLVSMDRGRAWARRVMWLLALFPTSLFFFSGYSESLFLLCLVLCVYNLRLERWWWAGLMGGLAAATRPLGIIVFVPFVMCWYQAHELSPIAIRPWLRHYQKAMLGALAIPAGLIAYMAYLWARFGNPFLFGASQRSWHRTLAWPWQSLGAAITRPFSNMPHLSGVQLHGVTDTLWALVFLAISIGASRSLEREYGAFLWLFWAVVLSTPALLDNAASPLISLPRFLATAFPLLIFLSDTRRRFMLTCAISVPLLVFNTAIFVSGGWVA
jgi:Gpi18-like mannosyltransferase